MSALDVAGPIDLAVAWFHTLKIATPRRLAERLGTSTGCGRLFQVLGSATADPAHPDRRPGDPAGVRREPDRRLELGAHTLPHGMVIH